MYYKGGAMLHMMRLIIGNGEKWRSVLRGIQRAVCACWQWRSCRLSVLDDLATRIRCGNLRCLPSAIRVMAAAILPAEGAASPCLLSSWSSKISLGIASYSDHWYPDMVEEEADHSMRGRDISYVRARITAHEGEREAGVGRSRQGLMGDVEQRRLSASICGSRMRARSQRRSISFANTSCAAIRSGCWAPRIRESGIRQVDGIVTVTRRARDCAETGLSAM